MRARAQAAARKAQLARQRLETVKQRESEWLEMASYTKRLADEEVERKRAKEIEAQKERARLRRRSEASWLEARQAMDQADAQSVQSRLKLSRRLQDERERERMDKEMTDAQAFKSRLNQQRLTERVSTDESDPDSTQTGTQQKIIQGEIERERLVAENRARAEAEEGRMQRAVQNAKVFEERRSARLGKEPVDRPAIKRIFLSDAAVKGREEEGGEAEERQWEDQTKKVGIVS